MSEASVDAPKVTVTTLSWNRKMHTLEWLQSLGALEYANFEVLIVDNGSTDGSVDAIRAKHPEVALVENGENLGYARGFNVGMKHAFEGGADYVLIMNNDAIIDPPALQALVDTAEADPSVAFVSGKVYHYWRPEEIQTAGTLPHRWRVAGAQIGFGEIDHGQYDEVTERELTDDVFLLVRRAAWERVGGYDNDFAYYGHENVDWCMRVREAGFKIMYTPHAKIWHKGRTGGGWTPFYLYHQTRNDYVLVAKHVTRPKAFVSAAMLALWYQPMWFFIRVRPTKLGQMKSFLRGQFEGLRWLIGNPRRRPALAAAVSDLSHAAGSAVDRASASGGGGRSER
jgi:GT2 family glycosyltransferase